MSEEGIEDELIGALHVTIQAGGQLAEMLARVHAQRLREVETGSRQEARELRARFDAERTGAVAELGKVRSPQFWENPDAEEIGQAYALAGAWRDYAPEAEAAEQLMREQLRTRFSVDVDVDATDGDPAKVRAQLVAFQEQAAGEERARAERERAAADALVREADRLDRIGQGAEGAATLAADPQRRDAALTDAAVNTSTAEEVRGDAGVEYDSTERRAEFAASMEDQEIPPEQIGTRIRADMSQGRPASEAVKTRPAGKAKRGRGAPAQSREADMGR